MRVSLYHPVKPDLLRRRAAPSEPMYLGMHCRGRHDLGFLEASRAPFNVIEVKPEHFRGEDTLFELRDGRFHVRADNFDRLADEARRLELAIQFHFPAEIGETGLNPGVEADHDLIISLFEATSQAIRDYALLPSVTFHPPALIWGQTRHLTEEDMPQLLEKMHSLLLKLERERAAQGWQMVVGIENQADPKADGAVLGYTEDHLLRILSGTPDWVNFTIDSGHRILSRDLTVTKILTLAETLGKRVINYHFHENQGQQTDSYHDDQHRLPIGKMIKGYLNYVRRAVCERAPIILEVNTKRHNPIQLLVVSSGIRRLMEIIEAERVAAQGLTG